MLHASLQAVAIALASMAPAAAQTRTWVVDAAGGPGSDFTEIQAAVMAAGEGDLVYVRGGDYLPFLIIGKSLTIHAESFAANVQHGGSVVRDLGPGQDVVLRGVNLIAQQGDLLYTDGLLLRDNQGAVWLEGALFQGAICPGGQCGTGEGAGLVVENCASVVINRCTIRGGETYTLPEVGDGLVLRGSSAHVYDTMLVGGSALDLPQGTPPPGGQTGGDAAIVDGGFLFLSGSTLEGGKGGDGEEPAPPQPCSAGGTGGAGVRLIGGAPGLVVLGPQPSGGNPGMGGAGCPNGPHGQPIVDQGGGSSVTLLPAVTPRAMTVVSPVVGGQQVASIVMNGEPGDEVVLLFHLAQSHVYLPTLQSTLVLPLDFAAIHFGFLPPAGYQLLQLGTPPLPPGMDFLELFLQLAYKQPTGTVNLGAPGHLAILSQAP